MVEPPWDRLKKMYHEKQYSEIPRSLYYHDIINREYITKEEDFCSVKCFDEGLDFLKIIQKRITGFYRLKLLIHMNLFMLQNVFEKIIQLIIKDLLEIGLHMNVLVKDQMNAMN